MALRLEAISLRVADVAGTAAFWADLLGRPALPSAALGWPLVWDQDEETAIQSPHGGRAERSWSIPDGREFVVAAG